MICLPPQLTANRNIFHFCNRGCQGLACPRYPPSPPTPATPHAPLPSNVAAGDYGAATQLAKTKTTLVPVRTQKKVKSWIIVNGGRGEGWRTPPRWRRRKRPGTRALHAPATLTSPAPVSHTQLQGKENVFRVTQFSSVSHCF